MKKQLFIVMVAAMTTSYMKFIFSMNQSSENKKEIVNPVTEFLKKNPHIEQGNDITVMREGILACTSALYQSEHEQSHTEIKTMRAILYNKLTEKLGSKNAAKEFMYGIIDDISDEEDNDEEKTLLKRTYYTKYKQQEDKIKLTKELENKTTLLQKKSESQKNQKECHIDLLKNNLSIANEELVELNNKIATTTKEFETIQQAIGVLSLKQSAAKNNIKKQQQELTQKITTLDKDIKQLKKELAILTEVSEIKSKKLEIAAAEKKLVEHKKALEYVSKDLFEIEGKTGFFGSLGWNLGLVHYAPNSSENNTNTNESFNNNTLITQVNPTIIVNIETTNPQNIPTSLTTSEQSTMSNMVKEIFNDIEKEIPSVYEHTTNNNTNNSYNDNTVIAQINPVNPSVIININTEHTTEKTEQPPQEDQKDK